jgi:hypothetical protein
MIPHVLYAAEVRPYALIMLLSILNVMAFARLARRPDRPSAWLVWAASALVFVSAALFAVIALAMQQAVLGVALVRRLGGRAGALALGSIGALAVVVGVWYAGVDLVQPHGRGSLAAGAAWRETLATVDFVFSHDRLLAAVFLLSLPVPIVRAWRGERALLPVAIVLSCGVLVIPLVVEVERWKDYYFHPRHILFVLPYLALVTAIGIDGALARLDPLRVLVRDRAWRTWTTVLAAVVLVVAVHASVVRSYLRTPDVFFARTKTLRDFKSLARGLLWQLWHSEPGTRIVLVAERNRAGHIGNPVLRRYLRWWGIERRVALHGTDRPEAMVETLVAQCPDGCAGESVDALVQLLGVGEAIDSPVRFRGLLRLAGPEDVGGGKIAGVGVLAYPRATSAPPGAAPPGWRRDSHSGLRLTQRQGSEARVSQ